MSSSVDVWEKSLALKTVMEWCGVLAWTILPFLSLAVEV